MALVLYRPVFWVLLVALALILLWLAHRLRLRWFLAWIFRMALIALVLFIVFSPRGEFFQQKIPQRQVLILDRSDSIPERDQQQVEEIAITWQSSSQSNIIVLTGGEVEVVSSAEEYWPKINSIESQMEDALLLSEELLGDHPGRLILASDGLISETENVVSHIEDLAGRGHEIEVIKLPTHDEQNDLFVGNLFTPTILWENTPFNVVVPVNSQRSGEVNIKLIKNGKLQLERDEAVGVGENYYVFDLETKSREILALEVSTQFEGDPHPENNSSFEMVQVFRSPRALFITEEVNEGNMLIESLSEFGIQIDIRPPKTSPKTLVDLENYQVVILNDVKAERLSHEQMVALKIFVSRLGGGLIFIGGQNSYTLGGYDHTILESIMPIILEPAPREERPPTTFVIVMDRSYSMNRGEVVKAIELAREAAMRAVEILQPEDYIGVMTFSDEPYWDVPIAEVGRGITLRQALDTISQIKASGGTYMYKALDEAILELIDLDIPGSRQVLLLSDGKSTDGDETEFTILSRKAFNETITVSTIALGEEADQEIMKIIAERSSGRFYSVPEATELPRIMVSESRAARSENIQTGKTDLMAADAIHPVLSGMSLGELPSLSGYNALTSRSEEGAEDILLSANFQDPVLSAWQYGLGRVVVWTSDDGGDWANKWLTWEKYGMFWSQIIRYALLNPALGPAQVDVKNDTANILVNIRIQDEAGFPINLLRPIFSFVNKDNTIVTLEVPQVGPGLYSIEYPAPSEGNYRAKVSYESGDKVNEIPAFFSVNYPTEWKPGDAKLGEKNLMEWVEAGKGKMISLEALLKNPAEKIEQSVTMDRVWWQLILVAIILWPVEIAVRRRWLPWK